MLDTVSMFNFIQDRGLILLIKALLLLLVFVYIIFTLIVISRVRTLNRTLHFTAARASGLIGFMSFLFFGLAISLFIIILVIV